jgi:hypothetical protein
MLKAGLQGCCHAQSDLEGAVNVRLSLGDVNLLRATQSVP